MKPQHNIFSHLITLFPIKICLHENARTDWKIMQSQSSVEKYLVFIFLLRFFFLKWLAFGLSSWKTAKSCPIDTSHDTDLSNAEKSYVAANWLAMKSLGIHLSHEMNYWWVKIFVHTWLTNENRSTWEHHDSHALEQVKNIMHLPKLPELATVWQAVQ